MWPYAGRVSQTLLTALRHRRILQKATKEIKIRLIWILFAAFVSFCLLFFNWRRCCGSGWMIKRESRAFASSSLAPGWSDVVFAFHDRDEIGPRMLGRIAKRTGSRPNDV